MEINKLEELARAATPGPWMRLFGERTVYDRMEDGCRGNAIVRADMPSPKDAANLDLIAAANPAAVLELIALIRKQEQALTDSNLALLEQTQLAERCRQQAETAEAENARLVAQIATMQHKPQPHECAPCKGINCGATDGVSHSVECAAEHAAVIAGGRFVPKGAAPTVKQLAAQLDSNEKWTIAEQKAFAPFLAQFPNECSQGILSLGSAWKHGQAYGMTLALEPEFAKAMADLDAAMAMSFKVDDADAAPQQHAQPLPKWIDDAKGRDPFTDDLIAYIEGHPVQQHAQAALSDVNRCEHCDGSGLVHRPDGTFLGTCGCIASQQPAAAPAPYQHDAQERSFIGQRLRRLSVLADYEPFDEDEFYYCSAFSILGEILREFEKRAAAPAIQQEGAALDERAAFEKHFGDQGFDILTETDKNGEHYALNTVRAYWVGWSARAALAAPAARVAVPLDLRHGDEVIRHSDQSVRIRFLSARAASEFERQARAALPDSAAPAPVQPAQGDALSQQAGEVSEEQIDAAIKKLGDLDAQFWSRGGTDARYMMRKILNAALNKQEPTA